MRNLLFSKIHLKAIGEVKLKEIILAILSNETIIIPKQLPTNLQMMVDLVNNLTLITNLMMKRDFCKSVFSETSWKGHIKQIYLKSKQILQVSFMMTLMTSLPKYLKILAEVTQFQSLKMGIFSKVTLQNY